MSFQPPFPSPFPSPFPTHEPIGLQAKLDFCMQKIIELECRIRQLESKPPLIATSGVKKQSLD